MSSFSKIKKHQSGNFWDLNGHMVYVDPFKELYLKDKSKNKENSSSIMWCILWMTDPDEEVNKYYRIIDKEERLKICKNFYPDFDIKDPLIESCLDRYPYLCMSSEELAYKLQKDQLLEISFFLSKQEVNFDTVKDLIELKAKMPKIWQEFEKVAKLFQTKKSEQEAWGRKLTAREKGSLTLDQDEDEN